MVTNMDAAVCTVREFHFRIGERVAERPGLLPGSGDHASELANELRQLIAAYSEPSDTLLCRATLALEELAEWLDAHARGSRLEAIDALADRLFVLLGDAVASGLPISEAFAVVAESNMTKASYDMRDGKGVKRAGYKSPKKQLQKLLGENPNAK